MLALFSSARRDGAGVHHFSETNTMKYLSLLVAVLAQVALAQAPSIERAPVIRANHALACPQGTRQVGGIKSNLELVGCMRIGTEGNRVFHGPMISLYKSGKVEAVGQAEEGFRSGKWTFFNEQGLKTGETEFAKGDYHGRRVSFFPTGQLKTEEHWINGQRQGLQKSFDEAGTATTVEYKNDRPVTAQK